MHNGLIVHPTHRVRGGIPVVQLYGRLDEGRPFLIEDDRFRPYFFILSSDVERLGSIRNAAIRSTDLSSFEGDGVTKVILPTPAALRESNGRLNRSGVRTFEADLPLSARYLIDHAVRSAVTIETRPRGLRNGMLYFRNPVFGPSDVAPALRTLSIAVDLESATDSIESVALVGCDSDELHVNHREPTTDSIAHEGEREMLLAVAARIRELDPDVLLGWNIADLDLRALAERMRALRIPLRLASLGRVPDPIDFTRVRSGSRPIRASVTGRVVLDARVVVRDALRLPDARLETAARHVLGEGALPEDSPIVPTPSKGPTRGETPKHVFGGSRSRARLVPSILEREGLFELTRQRSLLCGLPLDRVGASIAAFDQLYMPELRLRGVVAPCIDVRSERHAVQGGAVLSPRPGVVSNVAVYDFKSLYPSLIRTFNLDPLALAIGAREPEGAGIRAPGGTRFSREEAILPDIIDRFMRQRERARQTGKKHTEQAIKIMMNAMFGIFAAPSCRFFDPRLANAITGFGQQTLAWAAEACEREGQNVLYGDTDSLFVQLDEVSDRADALQQAETLRKRIAKRLAARITKAYGVEAHLELELETVFDRLLLPRSRKGTGSKKRYAGWIARDEHLEIVGLEAVRSDWPAVAGRLQRGMLTRLFRGEDMLPFLRDTITRMQNGKLDRELIYSKRIRKDSLDQYTESAPPHIRAARKREERTGPNPERHIRYVVTPRGPEPLISGKDLPCPIHYVHYLERVLRPVAEALLAETGQNFGEALGEPLQLRLL